MTTELNQFDFPSLAIEEGHNPGACFWVMPVRLARPDEQTERGDSIFMNVVEHKAQEISLDEYAVECFLWHFLLKHYDEALSVQYRDVNSMDFSPVFEWYLTHNVYTYANVRSMISEWRGAMKMLKWDSTDDSISAIIKNFPKEFHEQSSDEDTAALVSKIANFYERLAKRLEKMMDESPDFDCISFMGP